MNISKLNTRSSTTSIFAAVLLFSNHSVSGFGQETPRLQAKSIQVQVTNVRPNPRDHSDSLISVRVTIRAGKQTLVIPNCATPGVNKNHFCLARLKRANEENLIGIWPEGTLSTENRPSWHLTTINPNTEMSFLSGFSANFLHIHAGESLQVGFEAWSNAESTTDWKKATILMSPPFEFSSTGN